MQKKSRHPDSGSPAWVPNKINPKRPTPRHIIIKLSKDKEK